MAGNKESRISWQVEEYTYREKSTDWYWALGVIILTGAIISVVFNNIMLAILILMSGTLLGYFASRRPDIVQIDISKDGISFRNFFYPFQSIKGYAVEEHPLGSKLLIETSRGIFPILSIPLPENLDLEALDELLSTKLERKHLKEETYHRFMELLGF